MLFYADSGSVFIRRMEPIFDAVLSDVTGVIGFRMAGGHLEKHYTRKDVLEFMGMNVPEYADTPQHMASFMCFRGTEKAKQIASEYLALCCNPKLMMDFEIKNEDRACGFIDHRHDQSLWSLLLKKNNLTTLPDPTQWGVQHGQITPDQQYIFHTRDPR